MTKTRIDTNTYFDRRVPDALMDALREGGFAHSLVQYVKSVQYGPEYGLDLALRADPKVTESRATLYAGTENALHFIYHPVKGFRLDVAKKWQAGTPWTSTWASPHTGEQMELMWPAVEQFIEECIKKIFTSKGGDLKEGTVQAGVSRFGGTNPLIIDREARVGFQSKTVRDSVFKELRAPLTRALATASGPPEKKWLNVGVKSRKCDALAISGDGELLTIEIKPDSARSKVYEAPLQAWQYTRQFQRWADECAQSGGSPHDVLLTMYRQRRELGLSDGPENPPLRDPLTVRPAVAVRPGYTLPLRERLATVVDVLRSEGLDEPAMLFYTVNLVGRLDPFDPLDPDSWAGSSKKTQAS